MGDQQQPAPRAPFAPSTQVSDRMTGQPRSQHRAGGDKGEQSKGYIGISHIVERERKANNGFEQTPGDQ